MKLYPGQNDLRTRNCRLLQYNRSWQEHVLRVKKQRLKAYYERQRQRIPIEVEQEPDESNPFGVPNLNWR